MNKVSKVDDKSLMIAIPAYGGVVTATCLQSVFRLQAVLIGMGWRVALSTIENVSVLPMARNVLAAEFLASSFTRMLFVDADMGFRAIDILKMLTYVDADVVAGIYPKKEINWEQTSQYLSTINERPPTDNVLIPSFTGMFRMSDAHETIDLEAPFRVDAITTGLMLISRECLKRVEEKGVELVNYNFKAGLSKRVSKIPVFFHHKVSGDSYIGEDFYFCDLVSGAGGVILACPWFVTTHVGMFKFRGDMQSMAEAGIPLV